MRTTTREIAIEVKWNARVRAPSPITGGGRVRTENLVCVSEVVLKLDVELDDVQLQVQALKFQQELQAWVDCHMQDRLMLSTKDRRLADYMSDDSPLLFIFGRTEGTVVHGRDDRYKCSWTWSESEPTFAAISKVVFQGSVGVVWNYDLEVVSQKDTFSVGNGEEVVKFAVKSVTSWSDSEEDVK